MILYEYPFNERIRTYLRLENLFKRLGELMPAEPALLHHYALTTIFEIMDVAARADLKADLLRDLDRQRALFNQYRGNPAIAAGVLDQVIDRLDGSFQALNTMAGKAGQSLTDNEWLMSVRSRAAIPGGTCEFDLPAYHAWQNRPASQRRADLQRWSSTLVPLAESIYLIMDLLRRADVPYKVIAEHGQYQQNLPQNRTFQLLRLQLDPALGVVPEISGNRLMFSVRLMRHESDDRLHRSPDDTPLELTLCA